MGYLDSLIDPAFQKLPDGKTAFFPSGILAGGRVLPNEQVEATIRRQLRYGYIWAFAGMAVAFAIGKIVWPRWGVLLPAAVVPIFIGWYQAAVVRKLKELPFAGSKLSLRASAERQSLALGWGWLALLSTFCVVALLACSPKTDPDDMRV